MYQSTVRVIGFSCLAFLAGCSSSSNNNDDKKDLGYTDDSPRVDIAGLAIDGYLANAKVCLDLNLNTQCDAGEPSTSTDSEGKFTLAATEFQRDNYPLLMVTTSSTIDSDYPEAPVTKEFTFSAPAGLNVISPFSTLIYQQQANGISIQEAEENIKLSLGLNISLTIDYVAKKKEQSEYSDVHTYAQALTSIIASSIELAKQQAGTTAYQQFSGSIQAINDWLKDSSAEVIEVMKAGRQATLPDEFNEKLISAIKNQPRGAEKTSLSELGKDAFIIFFDENFDDDNAIIEVIGVPFNTTPEIEQTGEWLWLYDQKKWQTELDRYTEEGKKEDYIKHLEENPLGYEEGWYAINGQWVYNPFSLPDCKIVDTIDALNLIRNYCEFSIKEISFIKKELNDSTIAKIFIDTILKKESMYNEDEIEDLTNFLKQNIVGKFSENEIREIYIKARQHVIYINEYNNPLSNKLNLNSPAGFEFDDYKLLSDGRMASTNGGETIELTDKTWIKRTIQGMDMIEIIPGTSGELDFLVNKDNATFLINIEDEVNNPTVELAITSDQFTELTNALKAGGK